jgi:hypothetical protein
MSYVEVLRSIVPKLELSEIPYMITGSTPPLIMD